MSDGAEFGSKKEALDAEEKNAAIQSGVGLSLKQLAMRDLVNQEFEAINHARFSEDAFERENTLRNWVRKLLGTKLANISDAEEIIEKAKPLENGSLFTYSGCGDTVILIKTSFGHLDTLKNYIVTLESSVSSHINVELTFFQYIKLAFKTLFKRSE